MNSETIGWAKDWQTEWVAHEQMRAKNIHAYDALDKRIAGVRAARCVKDGVQLLTLVFVGTTQEPRVCAAHTDNLIVEAEVFIRGGKLFEDETGPTVAG